MTKQKVIYFLMDLFIGFLILGLLIGLIKFRTKGEPVNIWGIKPMIVLSGSMEPEILLNSVVMTYKTNSLEKGDIILFETNSKDYVVHRYYDDNPDGSIITKGDNNDIIDYEPVNKNKVFGKVILKMNFLAPYVTVIQKLFK